MLGSLAYVPGCLAVKQMFGMRKLSPASRAMILAALVEGMSINATARLAGPSNVTVLRLLADAGTFCADYHDTNVRGLLTARVEADEIWSFCGCKASTNAKDGEGHGDVWTWTAIDADSKLCIPYLVADRVGAAARLFMGVLAGRVCSRIQLTTNAHRAYPGAVREAFAEIDYTQIHKQYATERKGAALKAARSGSRAALRAPRKIAFPEDSVSRRA